MNRARKVKNIYDAAKGFGVVQGIFICVHLVCVRFICVFSILFLTFFIASDTDNTMVHTMLLRSDYRYIVFDLETTGLDKKYDEIIQIGIVEYNAQGDIIAQFSSYVKPITIQESALHDVVSMITGITAEQILNAPHRDEIKEHVLPFFGEKSILIGHSVDFDIHILSRYEKITRAGRIDTLPLAQALYPYIHSYALEIIAKNLAIPFPEESFHDALGDSKVTGAVFFALLTKVEALLYAFPYAREICKRTPTGLASCMSIQKDKYLLGEIPVLRAAVPTGKKTIGQITLPEGTRYMGDIDMTTMLRSLSLETHSLAFSHHPKVLFAQKKYAKMGIMTPLHEQVVFDMSTLHAFFTKKTYEEWERFCAMKYILHATQGHSSYQVLNLSDSLFVSAMRVEVARTKRKKLYTHTDLFEAISEKSVPQGERIVLRDKERVFDNWKRWKYTAYDFYEFGTLLDALVYKYELLEQEIGQNHVSSPRTQQIKQLRASYYIFLGYFEQAASAICKDTGSEKVSIASFRKNTYFFAAQKIWEQYEARLIACAGAYAIEDMLLVEKQTNSIRQIFAHPYIIHRKRGNRQERFLVQPEDSYVRRDDIVSFFEGYPLTFLSCIDKHLPSLSATHTSYHASLLSPYVLQKRKDIHLTAEPKVCIIAPSKSAAQQLIISLHKSNEYKDCFLGAEHITGGSGKIIQQAHGKTSYVLIGGYTFCIQCIAHGIEFDSIGALDIMKTPTCNPFTDIEYYAHPENKV